MWRQILNILIKKIMNWKCKNGEKSSRDTRKANVLGVFKVGSSEFKVKFERKKTAESKMTDWKLKKWILTLESEYSRFFRVAGYKFGFKIPAILNLVFTARNLKNLSKIRWYEIFASKV